jgi:hypothetical protein
MNYPEFHYKWEWRLRSPPERLWPFVADTNRFNRDTGLSGSVSRMTRFKTTPASTCGSRN